MTPEQKQKLLDRLEALKIFPRNKHVKALEEQIRKKLDKSQITTEFIPTQKKPNTVRSSKLRKYHRYIRMIRDSFPNLKYSDIRKQFSEKRKGLESDIPDVIWQNPSP